MSMTSFNRRSFLSSQLAIGAMTGISVMGASAAAHGFQDHSLFKQANNMRQYWKKGVASDFTKFVDQPFTAIMQDGTMLHLKLKMVAAGRNDGARPKSLPRSESVTLTFDSDLMEELVNTGHQTVTLWHSDLGKSEIFIGAVPLRNGGYQAEAVLN